MEWGGGYADRRRENRKRLSQWGSYDWFATALALSEREREERREREREIIRKGK